MDDMYLSIEEEDDETEVPSPFVNHPVIERGVPLESHRPVERPAFVEPAPVLPSSPPSAPAAADFVKISFDRFVLLVANHGFEDVIQANKDEEVIISSNLLTDLANAKQVMPTPPKTPVMVVAGLVIGMFLGYLLFT